MKKDIQKEIVQKEKVYIIIILIKNIKDIQKKENILILHIFQIHILHLIIQEEEEVDQEVIVEVHLILQEVILLLILVQAVIHIQVEVLIRVENIIKRKVKKIIKVKIKKMK